MDARKLGEHVLVAGTKQEGDEIAELFRQLDARARTQYDCASFCVSVYAENAWLPASSQMTIVPAMILCAATSMVREEQPVAIFGAKEGGALVGPLMVLGAPAMVVCSWMADAGSEFQPLMESTIASIESAAMRMLDRLAQIRATPAGTEH